MVNLTSCSPLPLLPLEIKHEVLRFCDPSTLAQTSRVSLAFLQLSSPLLYQNVEIPSFEKLNELFCSRDGKTSQPQVCSLLALNQIKTFTFKPWTTIFHEFPDLQLHPDRIINPTTSQPPSSLIPVDRLDLRLPFLSIHQHLSRSRTLAHLVSSSILPLFNPQVLHFEAVLTSEVKDDPLQAWCAPELSLRYGRWDRLRLLSLKNTSANDWKALDRRPGPFDIVVEFTRVLQLRAEQRVLLSLAEVMIQRRADAGKPITRVQERSEEFPHKGLEKVEIWVESEKRKESVKGMVELVAVEMLDPSAVKGRLDKIKILVRI